MLLLAKLLPSMDIIAQMIAQAKEAFGKAKTPTIEEICEATVLLWNQCPIKDTLMATQANKISAVKHKGDDPKFKQQQVLQDDSLKKKCKCGKCTGKKQKEKELKDSSSHMHAYIALVIYTFSPEPPVDPCALAHCPISAYQGEQGPPFHTGIKDAITFTHQLELSVTMENVCGLDAGLQIQGPEFLSTTIHLPLSSYSSLPCPPSLLFPSAHDTSSQAPSWYSCILLQLRYR